jgi:hypothetical protein
LRISSYAFFASVISEDYLFIVFAHFSVGISTLSCWFVVVYLVYIKGSQPWLQFRIIWGKFSASAQAPPQTNWRESAEADSRNWCFSDSSSKSEYAGIEIHHFTP